MGMVLGRALPAVGGVFAVVVQAVTDTESAESFESMPNLVDLGLG